MNNEEFVVEQTKKVPLCSRCKRSVRPRPRTPGDFMCLVCRSFQAAVSEATNDPCEQLLLMILGDDQTRQDTAPRFPRAKPVNSKKLVEIKDAMDGNFGTDGIRALVASLLPGERGMVLAALQERAGA